MGSPGWHALSWVALFCSVGGFRYWISVHRPRLPSAARCPRGPLSFRTCSVLVAVCVAFVGVLCEGFSSSDGGAGSRVCGCVETVCLALFVTDGCGVVCGVCEFGYDRYGQVGRV